MPIADSTVREIGSNAPMRVLGIDPGLRTTGFGVDRLRPARTLHYVASGTIRTDAAARAACRAG